MLRCKMHRTQGKAIELIHVGVDRTLDTRAERTITWEDGPLKHQASPWRAHSGGLDPGVYCRHCLAEGNHARLDYDDVDLQAEGLADEPLIFKQGPEFHVEDIWPELHEKFGESIVQFRDEPDAPAQYSPVPPRLLSPLVAALQRRLGPDAQLYAHQARAVNLALDGRHVVVETPTASGKSLTYAVPIFQAVLEDPRATALYISPLNALGEDQLESFTGYDEDERDWTAVAAANPQAAYLREIRLGPRRINLARYDGNVDPAYRQPVRDAVPNILVTNPEMLHWGILSHSSSSWSSYLSRLRYVVIDELHVYRGIFGGNMANLMRRLRRVCHYAGSHPQFICCSATIRNPVELAEAITGHRPELVPASADGSPKWRRRFVLWDTTRTDDSINTEAKNLVTELVGAHRVKTIAFMRSIPSVRALYQYTREELRDRHGIDQPLLASFYRALTPEKKRSTTQDLRSGRLQGVLATTALQLGIDIGDLSAAVIVKYPGSIAAVKQQAGRAGRRGEGLVFLLLDQDPLNQFFARHPEEFFDMGAEDVYVDPDNPYILLDHLWCAAQDRPIDPRADRQFWGDQLDAYLAELVAMERLHRESARDVFVLQSGRFPAEEVPVRAVGYEFPVFHGERVILREDATRAPRYLHKYARLTVEDELYEVTEFALDFGARQGNARVRKVPNPEHEYTTAAAVKYGTEIKSCDRTEVIRGLPLRFGTLTVTMEVKGYYKVALSARRAKDRPEFQALGAAAPPARSYDTRGLWLQLPTLEPGNLSTPQLAAGMRSLQKSLALATCIVLKADINDVAGLEQVDGPEGAPTVYIYDTIPGGAGLAEKACGSMDHVIRTARQILRDCPYCSVHPESRGCARCVSEEWGAEDTIDRRVALRLLDAILEG